LLSYGKVTYEVSSPLVAGVVTAVILIGSYGRCFNSCPPSSHNEIADERDEIDVELLGGDPSHWQANVFAPSPEDKQPLWGVFSSIEDVSAGKSSDDSISNFHKYSIDWSADRIVWGVDGTSVRTISKGKLDAGMLKLATPGSLWACWSRSSEQTRKNGALHYPSHPARVQLGIWDASAPVGTAQWAKGPIDWEKAPERMTAVVKSVAVECPNL
jgi:beta-glucanase (GH16 family)